jgi:selenocysteine lyase/cysteine desulfurase
MIFVRRPLLAVFGRQECLTYMEAGPMPLELSLQTVRRKLRDAMPIARKWAYFDHAAVAPLPASAAAAVREWSDGAVADGDVIWLNWSRRIEEIRRRAASLVSAQPEEIALVPNTTAGVNIVAEGIDWRAGDNVVFAANEFPTNQYAWMNLQSRGVEVRRVEPTGPAIEPQRVADLCDARTRLVSLSWVGYASGWRIDPGEMARVAHDHGALFFLDAIQGLGVFPLDVRATNIDFLAADGHKWLLGPEGAGVFFIKRELLDELRPTGLGWNSTVQHYDSGVVELNLRPTAARFEGGSQNMIGFHALGVSLDLLADYGLSPTQSPIADSVLDITRRAIERLDKISATIVSPRDDAHRSGIVSFDLAGRDPKSIRSACLKHNVVLASRAGHVRISPHGYNDEADIDRLITAIGS